MNLHGSSSLISLSTRSLIFFPAGEPRGDNAAPIGIYHHDFQPDPYK